MKLFAVVVDNLGMRKAFSVRADNPAAAVRLVLDDDASSRNFQALQVLALEELESVVDGTESGAANDDSTVAGAGSVR